MLYFAPLSKSIFGKGRKIRMSVYNKEYGSIRIRFTPDLSVPRQWFMANHHAVSPNLDLELGI